MTDTPPTRVLVVDNDPLVVTSLGTRLGGLGYHPIPAGTGAQALDTLRFGGIDLVITDLNMPVLDGLGLIERVRQHPTTAQIPIIVITGARPGPHSPLEFLPNVVLLRKPFDFQDLASLTHDLLAIRRDAA